MKISFSTDDRNYTFMLKTYLYILRNTGGILPIYILTYACILSSSEKAILFISF